MASLHLFVTDTRRGSLPRELLLSRDGGDLPPQQRWIFEKTLQHHTADAWMQRVEALDEAWGYSELLLGDMILDDFLGYSYNFITLI
jgi:hypothetical protein